MPTGRPSDAIAWIGCDRRRLIGAYARGPDPGDRLPGKSLTYHPVRFAECEGHKIRSAKTHPGGHLSIPPCDMVLSEDPVWGRMRKGESWTRLRLTFGDA